MFAMQFLRYEPNRPEPETGQKVQESHIVWSPLCRRRFDGVLRFHATIAQFQTTIAGMRRGQKEKLNDAYIPVAATSLRR